MAEFFNKNVKHMRVSKNYSQQKLADITGIDRSTISRIENNDIDTSIDNAIDIARALQVPLPELIGTDLTLATEEQKNELDELRSALIGAGLADSNTDDITDEQLEKTMKFLEANKDFLFSEDE